MAVLMPGQGCGPPVARGTAASGRACSSAGGEVIRDAGAGIEDAARRLGRRAGWLGPAGAHVQDLSGLRAIAGAAGQVRRDGALVAGRVAAARARGRSWNRIAVALGLSRHRFAGKTG